MGSTEQQKKQQFLINIAYWAVILAIVFLVFKYFIHLVMPFFLALIFAMLTRPAVRFLVSKLKFRKGFAAVVITVLFFAIIGTLLAFLVVKIIGGIGDVFSMLPDLYRDTLEPGLQALFVRLEAFAGRFNPEVLEVLESIGPQILSAAGNAVTSLSGTVVSWISSLVTKVPSFLVGLIICIIATFFMSVDYERLTAVLMRQLPERAREITIGVRRSLSKVIKQYGRSYALILGITFAELVVGMLVLRVNNAVLIALIIAILDIFPVLGTGTVLIPWAVISFIQGRVGRGLGLLIVYIIITIIRQVIEPKIVGKHVGLHPLITLICMFVGTSLFGVLGLFGLPIMMAILLELNSNGTIHIFKASEAGVSESETGQPDEKTRKKDD